MCLQLRDPLCADPTAPKYRPAALPSAQAVSPGRPSKRTAAVVWLRMMEVYWCSREFFHSNGKSLSSGEVSLTLTPLVPLGRCLSDTVGGGALFRSRLKRRGDLHWCQNWRSSGSLAGLRSATGLMPYLRAPGLLKRQGTEREPTIGPVGHTKGRPFILNLFSECTRAALRLPCLQAFVTLCSACVCVSDTSLWIIYM